MKKIQLFLKYLVLMLFLTVWIIIMFFTDYMNSQSVKLYCMYVPLGSMDVPMADVALTLTTVAPLMVNTSAR